MIRAKFRAHLVKATPYSDSSPCEQVQLRAVYSDDPQSENYSWSQATPTGDLHLTITNPDAIGKFQESAEYYLDITPVEVEAAVGAPAEETPEPASEAEATAEVQEPLHESGSVAEAEAVPETSPPVPAAPEEPVATEPAAEDTPDAESTAPASPQTHGTW